MTGNRVEELESRVAELQATVDGLTEELVETKERLRQLEADEEPARVSRTTDANTEVVRTEREQSAEAEPDGESETAAESDTTEAAEDAEDEAESESSDIIVA
ncbi:DUF7518 family protein [Salinirubrum litoreum]|uniref:Chromosome segregation protein SMC n=1 Tax=Salinirubrum litoreum TaxID=1126234 RepID=A0ABD5R704_9EURY|nr:bZIP transcription factor [Salinirubrum litoreum]